MPNPIAAGDIWRMFVYCTSPGQVSINEFTLIVQTITGGPPTDVDTVSSMDPIIAALYKPFLSGQATYYGLKLRKINPAVSWTPVYSAANIGVGTGGTQVLPTQVSGVLSFVSNTIGRSGRGRIYAPFPDVAFLGGAGDRPTTAYSNLLNALGALFVPWILTVGGSVVTFQLLVANKLATGVHNIVIGYEGRSKWGTQKKRGDYGRANSYPPF